MYSKFSKAKSVQKNTDLSKQPNRIHQMHRVLQLQKAIGNQATIQLMGQVVQKKPVLSEGDTYTDDKINGVTLTKITSKEKLNELLSKDISDDDWDYYKEDVYIESFSGKVVFYDKYDFIYVNLMDNTTWSGEIPDFDFASRSHYVSDGTHAQIVAISDIDYHSVGNIQDDKKNRIILGIKGGVPLPPVSVTKSASRYILQNGRNRIEASRQVGYTQIPIFIGDKTEEKKK